MKLKKVHVKNFRSIVDSGPVDIEERVTVLIGRNEQGKTTFLKALTSFQKSVSYNANDLPNHLRPGLEGQPPESLAIVSYFLTPSDADIKLLSEALPSLKTMEIQTFEITKFYDNHYEYKVVGLEESSEEKETKTVQKNLVPEQPAILPIIKQMKTECEILKGKLTADAQRLATFTPHLPQALSHIDDYIKSNFDNHEQIKNILKTLTTVLKGVPGQDAQIQTEISALAKSLQELNDKMLEELKKDPFEIIHTNCIPHILFHSTLLDKIPDQVPLNEFLATPEETSRGMYNLCNVAGLSIQKIQELSEGDVSQIQSYEDFYSGAISGGLNEFWTQATYRVHFRIDKEKLSVSISDGKYESRIAPSGRSDGFQWYLSFYSTNLNDINANEPTVLLLDNPGLELHSDGQRDIKMFLEEKLPALTQVIYVTHSPAMVDPFNLQQIRNVELFGNKEGTKISNSVIKSGDDLDLLEPVRSAIGTSLVSSLMFNHFNVLVEGAADKSILDGALKVIEHPLKGKILINGSVSENKILVDVYIRSGLPFIVLLDSDSAGRGYAAEVKKSGVPEDKILILNAIYTEKKFDFDIEDILSTDFYLAAVKETYPGLPFIVSPATREGKQTKHYVELFKKNSAPGFNKKRVSDNVKKLLIEKKADEGSLNALKMIVDKFNELFKK